MSKTRDERDRRAKAYSYRAYRRRRWPSGCNWR